ncbi:MAG: LamG domain-containing protein [Flavobacteriaceae bacterium]|nr:LamG domain-containing protein [Flavobacteriaceae bacterium]
MKTIKFLSVLTITLAFGFLFNSCSKPDPEPSLPSYVPTNGLVGWYQFKGNTNDLSVNNLHGTNNGAVLTTDRNGITDAAYLFNDCNISIPNSESINFSQGYTFAAWVYMTEFAHTTILDKIDPDCSEYGFRINGRLNGTYWTEAGCYGGSNHTQTSIGVLLNTWHFVVGTYGPDNNLNIYQDGVLINTFATEGWNLTNTEIIKIGSGHGATYEPFKGKIDDVGIWNRVLTQAEISSLFEAN